MKKLNFAATLFGLAIATGALAQSKSVDLVVTAPTTVRANTTFRVDIKLIDFWTRRPIAGEQVRINWGQEFWLSGSNANTDSLGNASRTIRLGTPGLYRIVVGFQGSSRWHYMSRTMLFSVVR